jgi:O-antigen/teichoic acid export membrane protein
MACWGSLVPVEGPARFRSAIPLSRHAGRGDETPGSRVVLRQSGVLLAARALQALVGGVSFVLATRQLGPEGFGELVTALGVAALAGGVGGAALSDAAVVAGIQPAVQGKATGVVWSMSVLVPAATAAFAGWNTVLAVLGISLFIGASVATAGRTAWARLRGDAWGLAMLQGLGAVASLAVIGVLVAASVDSWGAYVVAYAIQPVALLALSRPPRREDDGGTRPPMRQMFRLSRPYLISQSVWPMLAQVNVLALRALEGPGAVGRYGAMIRVLDLVAVGGPLLGTFALPAFTRLQAEPGRPSPDMARLNLTLGAVSTLPVVAAMPFGWLAWKVSYEDLPFPAVTFAVLALAYGVNTACGLPDRVLQATGRSPVVARSAGAGLVVLLVISPLGVVLAGLAGAAVALLVALGGINIILLQRSIPTKAAVVGHSWMGVVVAVSATVVALRGEQQSLLVSGALAASAVIALVAGAAAAHQRAPAALDGAG